MNGLRKWISLRFQSLEVDSNNVCQECGQSKQRKEGTHSETGNLGDKIGITPPEVLQYIG